MNILIDFLEKNESLLTDCEKNAISFGLYAMTKLNEEIIRELEIKPRSTANTRNLAFALDLGMSQVFRDKNRSSNEKDNGDLLVLLWDYLMPGYTFVDREVTLGSAGRADIVAKDKDGVNVVIELKASDSSSELKAANQVGRYAKEMSTRIGKPVNTMVINSTGVLSDVMDVITWSELGIFSGYAYAPDGFDDGDLAAICEVHNTYPKLIAGKCAYPYKVFWDYMYGSI